jgi:DNA-binding transcriptional MerR regulator
MEYSIKNLSELAGVSSRTLRYYDQIGLLSPSRTQKNGYRVYGQSEVDRLQEILFFRELGIPLEEIKKLIQDSSLDSIKILQDYRSGLLKRRDQLDSLINNVEKTVRSRKGMLVMNDKEKFEGLRAESIKDNEKRFGDEVRRSFGEKAVAESHRKFSNLTQEEYAKMMEIEHEIKRSLATAVTDNEDPKGETGLRIAKLHKEWLSYTWTKYTAAAHAGLVRMYLEDPRFIDYYDKDVEGCARFLNEAVLNMLK